MNRHRIPTTPYHCNKKQLSVTAPSPTTTITNDNTPRLRRPFAIATNASSRMVNGSSTLLMTTPQKKATGVTNSSSCPRSGGRRTPTTTYSLGVDRFIPDRNYLSNCSHSRNTLLDKVLRDQRDDHDDGQERRDDDDDVPVERQDLHQQHLRRVLFGEDDPALPNNNTSGATTTPQSEKKRNSHSSLLGIGCRRTLYPRHGSIPRRWDHHPSSHDVLRSPWTTVLVPSSSSSRIISKTRFFTLGVEGIPTRDDLHAMTTGPQGLAVPMWDTIGFNNPDFEYLVLEEMGTISALKWRSFSNDDTVLAVGGETSIQVWDMTTGRQTVTDHSFSIDTTALEWRTCNSPNEFLASTSTGIHLYDLRLRSPLVFSYNTKKSHAAKLQFQPDGSWVFAAALPRRNEVALWDLRRSQMPFQTMEHSCVKGMQFCPTYRNTLATGGKDGIRLWNIQGNSLRIQAGTKAPITTLTWSWDGTEVMVGFDIYLGVYQCSSDFSRIRKLDQWSQPTVGPVVAVETLPGETAGRAVSLHCEGMQGDEALICWEPFQRKGRSRKALRLTADSDRTVGTLACSPVVR